MLEEKVHYADEFIKLKEMLSCRDRMVVGFTLPMQSMHFTPNVKIVSDLWQVGGLLLQGRIQGGGGGAKIGINMIFWREIVIFHTKYPQNFAPPSAIGKNMIFWRKIVIFHTK